MSASLSLQLRGSALSDDLSSEAAELLTFQVSFLPVVGTVDNIQAPDQKTRVIFHFKTVVFVFCAFHRSAG